MKRSHKPPENALQKQDKSLPEPIEPEMLPPDSGSTLINARIIQIVIEKEDTSHVPPLLKAELDYNKERLAIVREHAELHPDAKEERSAKSFRRTQYSFLLTILLLLLLTIPFVNLAVASVFGILCMLIVSGVILNARERDIDLASFVKIISVIIGKKE